MGTKIKHIITNNIGIAQFDLLNIKGNRIAKASAAIKNYYKTPSGKTLHKTVILLEDLKFTRLSYLLEKQELNAHDKKFRDEFYAADTVK